MKSGLHLDIIIVNFNSTDHLLRCLKSLYNSLQNFPANIFVQDNASTDDIDRVTSAFPQVILSKSKHNMGFSKAVNDALAKSSAPYVAILNPDTYVKDNFFESITSYMAEHFDIGIIGPKILGSNGDVQGSARSFPSPLTAFFGRTTILSKLFPKNRISSQNILTTKADGITPMEVDWVSGACMLVRRKAIETVGLLDEGFFMYWEDADWCRRMRNAGWKVVYFPKASIVHYVGGSSEKLMFRSFFEFHKSCYRLFYKHNSNFYLRMAKPFVFLGLAIRFCGIFILHLTGLCRQGSKIACKGGDNPLCLSKTGEIEHKT